jgi:alpha-1,2-mannosyltransferase
VLLIVALAAGSATIVYFFAVGHGAFDLRVYYGAVNYWAHGRGQLYDYLLPLNKYGFTYPPFAAVTMLPMAVLPLGVVVAFAAAGTVVSTLIVLYLFVAPVARRHGWPRWYVFLLAAAVLPVFEPLRETISFGQVNMLLVVVVAADMLLLVGRGSPYGGIGIGLATAVKLTPGVFLVYLLVAGRFRAAFVAGVTALTATVVTGVFLPDETREFWTGALWDTDRVGTLSFISNQSIEGAVWRVNQDRANQKVWLALVLVVTLIWAWRAWRAGRRGDIKGGLALTGVFGALVSPVTWIHHLVWLLPALLLLVDRALLRKGRQRIALLVLAAALYALLSSRLPWAFAALRNWHGVDGWVYSNAYAWASLVLLIAVPLAAAGSGQHAGVADLGEGGESPVAPGDVVAGTAAVQPEPGPLVEPAGTGVSVENPQPDLPEPSLRQPGQ